MAKKTITILFVILLAFNALGLIAFAAEKTQIVGGDGSLGTSIIITYGDNDYNFSRKDENSKWHSENGFAELNLGRDGSTNVIITTSDGTKYDATLSKKSNGIGNDKDNKNGTDHYALGDFKIKDNENPSNDLCDNKDKNPCEPNNKDPRDKDKDKDKDPCDKDRDKDKDKKPCNDKDNEPPTIPKDENEDKPPVIPEDKDKEKEENEDKPPVIPEDNKDNNEPNNPPIDNTDENKDNPPSIPENNNDPISPQNNEDKEDVPVIPENNGDNNDDDDKPVIPNDNNKDTENKPPTNTTITPSLPSPAPASTPTYEPAVIKPVVLPDVIAPVEDVNIEVEDKEIIIISDEEVPLAELPQTGFNFYAFIPLLIVVISILIIELVKKIKNEKI